MTTSTRPSTTDSWNATMDYILGKKRAEEALGFLTTCGRDISAATRFPDAAGAAARLLVPFLADWVLVGDGSGAAAATAAHPRAERDDDYAELTAALGDGGAPVHLDVTAGTLGVGDETGPAPEALLERARRAEVAAAVLLPADSHGRVHGSLRAVRISSRREPGFGPAALLLLADTARRLGTANELLAARSR